MPLVSDRGRRRVAAVCLGVCLAGAGVPRLGADVVHLKNGSRVEGDVTAGSKAGQIKVILDKGLEVEFAEKDIREIEKKKSPSQEFEERLAALPAGDVDALLELADWARERKLRSREEQIYRKVIELDSNDPVARRELGYAVFRNRWIKESELRTKHGLIQFRGDWVTPEEKERRIFEELNKEIGDLLSGVDTDNQYIREYSIRKLLEYRDPRARTVVLRHLGDEREAVRVVAVQVLVSLPVRSAEGAAGAAKTSASGKSSARAATSAATSKVAGGDAKTAKAAARPAEPAGPSEDEVARALLARTLREESPTVRTALANALQKLRSRRFFELALEAISTSENPLHRDRAAEGILFGLQKAWVGELIRALPRRPPGVDPSAAGNPAVRDILEKVFHQGFEFRVADWERWWAKNQGRYTDE